MCGGGKKSTPAPQPTPTYQYYPAPDRTQQQQVAATQTENTTASFGSELASTAPATPAAGGK